MTRFRLARTPIALVFVCALSLSLAACGDADSDGDGSEAESDTSRYLDGCTAQCPGFDTGADSASADTTAADSKTGDVDGDDGDTAGGNHKWVQIVDRTREQNSGQDIDTNGTDDAEDACDQTGSTGSDIFGVELADSEGQTIAWGETIAVETTAQRSDGTDYTAQFWNLIDGEPPALNNADDPPNACPSGGFQDSVAPLGCEGSLVVGFPTDDGGWWSIEENYQVRVYEYGDQCFDNCDPTQDFAACSTDYAQIHVCEAGASKDEIESGSPDGDGIYPGCNTPEITLGSGYIPAPVELP